MTTADAQPTTCSHPGCGAVLPTSHRPEVPPGWSVARVEEHSLSNFKIYYLYTCPRHVVATAEKQETLFPGDATP